MTVIATSSLIFGDVSVLFISVAVFIRVTAGALLVILVPSDVKTFPLVPAVAGYVAVDHPGSADTPPERNICPAVPAASV